MFVKFMFNLIYIYVILEGGGLRVLIKYEACEIFDSYLLDNFYCFLEQWCGICRFMRSSMLLVCMAPLTPIVLTMRV